MMHRYGIMALLAALITGCVPWQPQEASVASLIKRGHYAEALARYSPEGVQQADIGTQATYDLLRVLVETPPPAFDELLCAPVYARYPNSHSYSMKLCAILESHLEEGRVSEAQLADLETFLRENYRQLRYLAGAARDLQGGQ
ncbi:hypothetical protein [Halomonas sp. 328]|uniref:hypothetical protein n=1 Tax=Halomonas sp. 328 TaxID=2776704 RepID=UPI0018A77A10|nr:hypothetical protein [Halomonas sp. 328]MBF8222418.1 hypothetical protein [Halomonas sp. 328]